jgi:hypothetical protein
MIIINICLNPLGFNCYFSHECDPYTIKVVYEHTRIASYQHWCVGNVERRVRLLALVGNNAELAGGFLSDPILSSPRRTEVFWLSSNS